MVGDELPLIEMISTTTTTMKASATTGTHRAPGRERLAGRTGVKLPRGLGMRGAGLTGQAGEWVVPPGSAD